MPQVQDTIDAGVEVQSALATAWEKVDGWLEGLLASLPNIIAAVVLLLVFWLLARGVRRTVVTLMNRFARKPEINRLIAGAAYILVLSLGLILALGVLDLDKTVTSLLAGAGILGLALGFAFQDIAANFMAGILLNVRNQFVEGDIIETNEHMGVVERVNLRATLVRTFAGQRVVIPNADVFKKPLVNYTHAGKRRVDIPVGVAYGDDLEKARRVAIDAVAAIETRDRTRDIELFYDGFGESSINFQIRFWIDFARQTEYLQARSDAIMRIKAAFDEAGITIPFPIRTLDFGGGQVGGQGLVEAVGAAGLTRRSGIPGGSPEGAAARAAGGGADGMPSERSGGGSSTGAAGVRR